MNGAWRVNRQWSYFYIITNSSYRCVCRYNFTAIASCVTVQLRNIHGSDYN